MYSQAAQYQPYQPYLQPVASPGDNLDQASRLVDLIERIAGRQGGNIAPGTSQYSPLNVGQFQSRSPQELAAQEMQLRTLGNSVPDATRWAINQARCDILNVFSAQGQQMKDALAMSSDLKQAVTALLSQVVELEASREVGEQINNVANAYSAQLNAAYEVIRVQEAMLDSPLFLLAHTFQMLPSRISPENREELDLVSSFYLELVQSLEETRRARTGHYSTEYSNYLQQQMDETQIMQATLPQKQVAQMAGRFAEGMRQPDFGQSLRRAHTMRNMARFG